MTTHERIFGNVMVGLILGAVLWATLGGVFGAYFRDDYYLVGHWGGRALMYGDSFAPGF